MSSVTTESPALLAADVPTPHVAYGLGSGQESVLATTARGSYEGSWYIAAFFLVMLFFAGLRKLGAMQGWSLALTLTLVGITIVAIVWIGTRSRNRASISGIPARPDPSARVGCTGSATQLARVRKQGEIVDVAFEPAIFRGVVTFQLNWSHSRAHWASVIAALVVLLIVRKLIGWNTDAFILLYIAFAIGACIPPAITPVYARVVPGRIDVMKSGLFDRKLVKSETYDLRRSAVLVDLNQHCVFLAADGATREIGFGYVLGKPAFAHAVLLAAVSTHEPAPLPDDALIG